MGYFRRERDHCENLLFAKARHHAPRWRPPSRFVQVHPPKFFPQEAIEKAEELGLFQGSSPSSTNITSHLQKVRKLRLLRRAGPAVATARPPRSRAPRVQVDAKERSAELPDGWMQITHKPTEHIGLPHFYARQAGSGAFRFQMVWSMAGNRTNSTDSTNSSALEELALSSRRRPATRIDVPATAIDSQGDDASARGGIGAEAEALRTRSRGGRVPRWESARARAADRSSSTDASMEVVTLTAPLSMKSGTM